MMKRKFVRVWSVAVITQGSWPLLRVSQRSGFPHSFLVSFTLVHRLACPACQQVSAQKLSLLLTNCKMYSPPLVPQLPK